MHRIAEFLRAVVQRSGVDEEGAGRATLAALAERVRCLQPVARFSYLWVREDGSVSAEHPDHGAT